ENVKKYMLEVRDNILKGLLRRVPMGILASGPPGTGKTFFFECFAYECGFNFVKIVNPQEMWVGSSEKRMAKILSALDDVSPVIVLEDEADQSEAPRGSPVGDSGVSNHLRQMKFEFCSDPKRRGKVIWIRITNRPDLLDAAYKRKGRTDDHIAFVMPNADACAKIFAAIFKRYQIPTTVSDFSLFGEKTAEKIYCTGADIEWMTLEADKIAGREGKEKVGKKHLMKMIESWKPKARPEIIDQQIILALEEADEHLNPDGWEKTLEDVYKRQFERNKLNK
ncbi:MAG: ATP-binding protein, partial [Patescibacteria group bacterium]